MISTVLSRNKGGGSYTTEVKVMGVRLDKQSKDDIPSVICLSMSEDKQKNLLPVASILKPIFTTQTYHLHLPTCFLCTASYALELLHALGEAAKRDVRDCTCNIVVGEGKRGKGGGN